jgi:ssDNA-binding Zn-finger/Zn-ribbon topoisomerase 1
MIDRFTKQEFEDALPTHETTQEPLWEYAGFESGENVYHVPIPGRPIIVVVRSSVGKDGRAADSGNDSIRLYLAHSKTGKPLAKKVDAWTQRTSGWQDRMIKKIRVLYQKGMSMVSCPQCGGVLLKKSGRYGTFWGCSNYPRCRYTANSLDKVPQEQPTQKADDDTDYAAVFEALSNEVDTFQSGSSGGGVSTNTSPSNIQLNEQQRAFVEAPVDADIRVMAGPGSGKTTSMIQRIKYLIENGVDPNAIVYVTLTKSMAEEGRKRILAELPSLSSSRIVRQICTIHALCLRILREEGINNRDVVNEWDWRLKKSLTQMIEGDSRDNIEGEWEHQREKPGYKEVLWWVECAKNVGLRSDEDMRLFTRSLTPQDALRVHNVRQRFDEWLRRENFTRFADMLFEVEQHLVRDSSFRNKYQARFTHVLADEAQDVNAQALRILITLSLDPGDNWVYNRWQPL